MVRVEVDGVGVEVQVEGEGPAVLLVHGWPDTHDLWRHQVGGLVDAGLRVIVPDLRGFGASDKPSEVGDYAMPYLVGDLVGVLDHLGVERAHVVGHDWGAALGWSMAAFVPERVDRLVTLSVGHPAAFASAGFAQREKSWYMLLFQFQGVAEAWLSADDFGNFRAWSGHPDADRVVEQLRDPAALTATLNLYRANVPPESMLSRESAVPAVAAPTMGIWSSGDIALLEDQMTASSKHVTGPWRYERVDGAGHWIPLEAADRLTELLLDFLI
jgi:pimeloyl-ACP methyl ester carboxylesterase